MSEFHNSSTWNSDDVSKYSIWNDMIKEQNGKVTLFQMYDGHSILGLMVFWHNC